MLQVVKGGKMFIDHKELGRRLREARETAGMTQDAVAKQLNFSRATIAQMELGNRAVSSLELDKLAYIYGRDIGSFFAQEFNAEDTLSVLFRANPDLVSNEEMTEALRKSIFLGRELTNLESLLGLSKDSLIPAVCPVNPPRKKWEAIRQGESLASSERRRLDLGDGPISDIVELLERQGVRTRVAHLPQDVSGMTIKHPEAGLLVVVNETHVPHRQVFSFAHEYGHVLLDRDCSQTVSRTVNREDLLEVRVNAFAAAFLLPETGVWRFVASLGKGQPCRTSTQLYDEESVVEIKRRIPAQSQAIQIYDVLLLSHAFGVSAITALYRLRNITHPLIDDNELESMQTYLESARLDTLKWAFNPDEITEKNNWKIKPSPKNAFRSRFLALAFEAYRREKISRSKLVELANLMDINQDGLDELIDDLHFEERSDENKCADDIEATD
jgi:Zn-dependent peptidase ImmA (M78 family)/transcriptional regulator with XRE-family HTH domain